MDYESVSSRRVDPKEFSRDPPLQHIDANIVLIDKTQNTKYPLVYQFQHDLAYSDEHLANLEYHYIEHLNDSFLFLGELQQINKKNSLILLQNGNTVSYKYLITVSDIAQPFAGSADQTQEFTQALRRLIEALRVTKKVARPNTPAINKSKESKLSADVSDAELPLQVNELFSDLQGTKRAIIGKRMFELQL